MNHALTSSATFEHYTPIEWIERVRLVMGGIDTDPCSCAEADHTVQSRVFYTEEDDGLMRFWFGSVFVNPPGGKGLPAAFWEKLADEVLLGRVQQFIWLAFNISHLRVLQNTDAAWLLRLCDVCIPPSRIKFTGNSPTKDSAFLYYGPNRDRFRAVFADAGIIWRGMEVA